MWYKNTISHLVGTGSPLFFFLRNNNIKNCLKKDMKTWNGSGTRSRSSTGSKNREEPWRRTEERSAEPEHSVRFGLTPAWTAGDLTDASPRLYGGQDGFQQKRVAPWGAWLLLVDWIINMCLAALLLQCFCFDLSNQTKGPEPRSLLQLPQIQFPRQLQTRWPPGRGGGGGAGLLLQLIFWFGVVCSVFVVCFLSFSLVFSCFKATYICDDFNKTFS